MDKYCTICKMNELLTPQEKANKVCNVCFGKKLDEKEKREREKARRYWNYMERRRKGERKKK